MYSHFFFLLRNALYARMHINTCCSAVGCIEPFHTLEDFLNQMYLSNHKLLLSNFIVLDKWTIRWNPVVQFCSKPALIMLNLPYNKQMLQ